MAEPQSEKYNLCEMLTTQKEKSPTDYFVREKTCSADFEILWNWPSSGEANDEDDDEDEEEDHGALRDGPAHHDVVAAHPHRPPRLRVLLHHCLEK